MMTKTIVLMITIKLSRIMKKQKMIIVVVGKMITTIMIAMLQS